MLSKGFPTMEIQGKTALITGGAKRIGRSIALTLAGEGMNLLLHYHHSLKDAHETQKAAERLGARVHLLKADLGKSSDVHKLIREAYRHFPKVHVLVNNASIFYKTPLGKVKEKDWDTFFAINLKAPFFLAQAIGLKMFRQKEGKIINLIDWTAFRPYSRYLPYCASKAGLAAVTQGLAKILAPYVQVNGIAPGPILPSRDATFQENKRIIKRTPLKRFGDPGDIAEAVRFLVKATDFVTGAIFPIDGGNLIA
ncbi:MAG: SDR family oxidoreductase [Candidatus Omnitrophica bacterium]|nr:SDR family oxidoreductase [Candidatus Omnitrophota bacterium]